MSIVNFYLRERRTYYGASLDFNNRWYEPFHSFYKNHNLSKTERITERHLDHFIIKPECFSCTGPWEYAVNGTKLRPMSCYQSPDCKMKFRYFQKKMKDSSGNIIFKKIEGSVELRENQKNGGLFLIDRPTFVANATNNFPFIVRASKVSGFSLHHGSNTTGVEDHYDDSPGRHVFIDTPFHIKYHSTLTKLKKSLKNLNLLPSKRSYIELEIKKIRMTNLSHSDGFNELISFIDYRNKGI